MATNEYPHTKHIAFFTPFTEYTNNEFGTIKTPSNPPSWDHWPASIGAPVLACEIRLA